MVNDENKVSDWSAAICDHIKCVNQQNSPERIYFHILYNLFENFFEEIDQDALSNDLTGCKDSLIWNKLFNYQLDAATGIINKLEMQNGCILKDSVGLGKTFNALAVIEYYELRNWSVLMLCPKQLADNWCTQYLNVSTEFYDRANSFMGFIQFYLVSSNAVNVIFFELLTFFWTYKRHCNFMTNRYFHNCWDRQLISESDDFSV